MLTHTLTHSHPHTLTPSQKHQAYVKQLEVERVRADHEERRKTMGAEVKQHQERAKFEDQLARRRYDDQLSQQVRLFIHLMVCAYKHAWTSTLYRYIDNIHACTHTHTDNTHLLTYTHAHAHIHTPCTASNAGGKLAETGGVGQETRGHEKR